jgi:pimeloyl-ACP methyl ester carboxylesterase
MTTRAVKVNGLNLVFEDEGRGRGDPLVFLHGSMGSTVYWDVLVPLLLGKFRCVRLEFPGHGRSDRSPTAAYGMDDQVDVAVQFLAEVSGPCIVIGASAGAGAAFGVAARRPDLVQGIYADDAYPGIYTGTWVKSSPYVRFFHLVGEVLRSMPRGFSVAEYAAALGQARLGPATMFDLRGPEFVAFFARLTASTDPSFFDVVTDPDRFWTDDDVSRVVRGLRCPVHVAYGDAGEGSLVPVGQIDALAHAGVEVTRTHFPGAGHAISPMYPAQSLVDIEAFVERVAHPRGALPD